MARLRIALTANVVERARPGCVDYYHEAVRAASVFAVVIDISEDVESGVILDNSIEGPRDIDSETEICSHVVALDAIVRAGYVNPLVPVVCCRASTHYRSVTGQFTVARAPYCS